MELPTFFWCCVLIFSFNLNGIKLEQNNDFKSNYIPHIRSGILKLLQNNEQLLKSGIGLEGNAGTTPKLLVVSRTYELTTKVTGEAIPKTADISTSESSIEIKSNDTESTSQTPSTQRIKRTTTIPTEPDNKLSEELPLNTAVNNDTITEMASKNEQIIHEKTVADNLELQTAKVAPIKDQHNDNNDDKILTATNSTERNLKNPPKTVYKVSIKLISAITTNMDPYMPLWYSKSDTYAIIYKCAPGKKGKIMDQSEVISDNNKPKWNWTTRTFEATDADSIRIELWDKDIIWSDFIGSVEVNLASKKLVNKRITMKHGLGTITFCINKYKM